MIYVDSSALVPLYVPERFSANARMVVLQAEQVPLTALHRLEVPNAFELLVGRQLITRDECRAVGRQFEDDVQSRRLAPVPLDLEQVFADAEELSARYTARLLTRSLNLLHVAAARLLLCETFVSADDRQLAVARASSLSIVDIKRSVRRTKR